MKKKTPSERPDICAFILLDKLVPEKMNMIACTEHDQIWFDVDVEQVAAAATEADVIYLQRCGIRFDKNTNSLSMFV